MAFEKPKDNTEKPKSAAEQLTAEVDSVLKLSKDVEDRHDAMGEDLYKLAHEAFADVRGETQASLAELRNDMLHREASSEK
jgi:hypothetical protein